jgi:hypothetical protein
VATFLFFFLSSSNPSRHQFLKNDEGYEYLLGPKPSQDAIKELLKNWCREGIRNGARYLLVVRNVESNENYPTFVYNPDGLTKKYQRHHNKNTSEVIGVYDLNDKRNQGKDLDQKK